MNILNKKGFLSLSLFPGSFPRFPSNSTHGINVANLTQISAKVLFFCNLIFNRANAKKGETAPRTKQDIYRELIKKLSSGKLLLAGIPPAEKLMTIKTWERVRQFGVKVPIRFRRANPSLSSWSMKLSFFNTKRENPAGKGFASCPLLDNN